MRGRGGPAGAAEAAGLPGREQPGPGQPGAPSAGLDRPVSVPRSPPPQSPAARRPRRWGGGRAWVSAAPRGPPWGLAERRVTSIWCQLFRGDGGGGVGPAGTRWASWARGRKEISGGRSGQGEAGIGASVGISGRCCAARTARPVPRAPPAADSDATARSAERGLVRKGAAQPGPEPGEGGAPAASPLAC